MPAIIPASKFESRHRSRSSGSSAAYVEKPSIERMWAASRIEAGLFIFKNRLALLDESGHAFLLVLERELGMEKAPLEQHALRERGLVGAIHRFLDHHHHGQRVACDPAAAGDGFLHPLVERPPPRHEPPAP